MHGDKVPGGGNKVQPQTFKCLDKLRHTLTIHQPAALQVLCIVQCRTGASEGKGIHIKWLAYPIEQVGDLRMRNAVPNS